MYLVFDPFLNVRWQTEYLMMWSLMVACVSSWGQLPNPIGDAGLHFVTWVDIFPSEDNVFVYLSTMPDVHINLLHVLNPKIPYICDSTFL